MQDVPAWDAGLLENIWYVRIIVLKNFVYLVQMDTWYFGQTSCTLQHSLIASSDKIPKNCFKSPTQGTWWPQIPFKKFTRKKKMPQIPKGHSHPSWNVIHRISSRPASWPLLINESSEVKTECCHRHLEVVLETWSHLQQRPEFARSKLCDQAFQLVNVLVHSKREVHLIAFPKRIMQTVTTNRTKNTPKRHLHQNF